MDSHRTVRRRILDEQLAGLTQPGAGSSDARLGQGRARGPWNVELRVGEPDWLVADPRAAVRAGRARRAIRLSSLVRAAQALNCTLVYAFAPNEPLEEMVYRQALHKAAADLSLSVCDDRGLEDQEEEVLWKIEELEELAVQYIDRQGLWREPAAQF
jgi:hypothetical protein